jgi:phage baseplate assembly protein W
VVIEMAIDFNKAAGDLLNTPAGAKLTGKQEELNKLIDSPEAQKVKDMLSGDEANVKAAIENGDMAVLKKTLSNILKTEEGSRLAEQLLKMMN